MSEETKFKLQETVETRLNQLTEEIDGLNKTFSKLERLSEFSDEKGLDINFGKLKSLLEYRLFIGILTLDLCTAILIYLKAKFQYEGLYSARQIIVIISEGYKKIYNFTTENDFGDIVLKHRNNSFWIKEIGNIIKDLPDYQSKYEIITEQLNDCLSINFKVLKNQRDLSIHYDKEPIKVYNMVSNLNIEETFKKLIPFLNILNEMFAFTLDLVQGYSNKSDNERKLIENNFDDLALSLNRFKTSENNHSLTDLQEKILAIKTMFD